MKLPRLEQLAEAKAKKKPDHLGKMMSKYDSSPEAQLGDLPQPIGINGGSYTYWVDVTKKPLKFTASDGSELDEAKTLRDIGRWMERWAEELWFEYLDGHQDLQTMIEERIIRVKKGRMDQEEHESDR